MSPDETTKRTNIKRIPENSYTMIFKFENKKERDECLNSEDFQDIYSEIAKLLINYNCRIELIKWDLLLGKTEK